MPDWALPAQNIAQPVWFIDYRSAGYYDRLHRITQVFIVSGSLGVIVFALVTWWLASRTAAPLVQLAAAARRIGAGNWQQNVHQVDGAEELVQLSLDLERMRAALSETARQLREQERLATVGSFTATIAHEVRNPLAAVLLILRRMEQKGALPKQFDRIQRELRRLDLVVDELLAYAGGVAVDLKPCHLETVLTEVIELLRDQAEHAGVELSLCGSSPELIADPRRIQQIALNLMVNAIQAQPEGGALLSSRLKMVSWCKMMAPACPTLWWQTSVSHFAVSEKGAQALVYIYRLPWRRLREPSCIISD